MLKELSHHDWGNLQRRNRLPIRLIFAVAEKNHRRREKVVSRHLLYEGENLCLDLCLDLRRNLCRDGAPSAERAKLTGQLAHRFDPLRPCTGMSVLVTSGERVLARAASNRQGEFELEYEHRGATALFVPIGEDQLIEVPM